MVRESNIDKVKLAELMEEFCDVDVALHVFDETDSTQTLALESVGDSVKLFVADQQKQGRGRNGREWFSESGSQILCSLNCSYKSIPKQLSALGLMLAVELVNVLEREADVQLRLKWPNDIYLDNAKLAGLLIDVRSSSYFKLVVGLGMNVNLSSNKVLGKPVADLSNANKDVSREDLIAKIVSAWLKAIDQYMEEGFDKWQQRYNDLALYKDKKVVLSKVDQKGEMIGFYKGVSKEGCLLLEVDGAGVEIWDSEWSLSLGDA